MLVQKPRSQLTRKERIALDRSRIERLCDPVQFMCDVVAGNPIPERDLDGNVVRYTVPDLNQRMGAASQLIKKVAPDIQSVSIEEGDQGETQIVVKSPVPLPGSLRNQPNAEPPQLTVIPIRADIDPND